jgi:RimJ/RimL family protein N-acetyltransferase
MTGHAETERLLLEPWSESRFEEFARVLQDPEAMRFISGGTALPLETIRSISQRSLAMWDEYGYGPWVAVEKETGRWVGRIGLNQLADWPGPDRWEVGYELAPEFWGRGLATEGAREAIRLGWAQTPLPRIISATAVEHLASRRVMETPWSPRGKLCHYPARPSACPHSSQSSRYAAGVTPGGGVLRLSWLIRVLWLIRGPRVHLIHHEARINHPNVTEAADVSAVAPSPRLVAHRPPRRGEEAGFLERRSRLRAIVDAAAVGWSR